MQLYYVEENGLLITSSLASYLSFIFSFVSFLFWSVSCIHYPTFLFTALLSLVLDSRFLCYCDPASRGGPFWTFRSNVLFLSSKITKSSKYALSELNARHPDVLLKTIKIYKYRQNTTKLFILYHFWTTCFDSLESSSGHLVIVLD